MLWADKAWSELPALLAAANGAAILPVGATEQHGPQLGCGMDFILADKLCRRVAAETGVPMLPTMPYGCSLGHSKRWPGTIALDPVLMTGLVTQIGTWAYHSGVRRLFIVNTRASADAFRRSLKNGKRGVSPLGKHKRQFRHRCCIGCQQKFSRVSPQSLLFAS